MKCEFCLAVLNVEEYINHECPPRMTADTPTDVEKALGVEYIDPKYPPGEQLRYGLIWDDRALAVAHQVRAEMVKRGERTDSTGTEGGDSPGSPQSR
jgi:hypothetical protein